MFMSKSRREDIYDDDDDDDDNNEDDENDDCGDFRTVGWELERLIFCWMTHDFSVTMQVYFQSVSSYIEFVSSQAQYVWLKGLIN